MDPRLIHWKIPAFTYITLTDSHSLLTHVPSCIFLAILFLEYRVVGQVDFPSLASLFRNGYTASKLRTLQFTDAFDAISSVDDSLSIFVPSVTRIALRNEAIMK